MMKYNKNKLNLFLILFLPKVLFRVSIHIYGLFTQKNCSSNCTTQYVSSLRVVHFLDNF